MQMIATGCFDHQPVSAIERDQRRIADHPGGKPGKGPGVGLAVYVFMLEIRTACLCVCKAETRCDAERAGRRICRDHTQAMRAIFQQGEGGTRFRRFGEGAG